MRPSVTCGEASNHHTRGFHAATFAVLLALGCSRGSSGTGGPLVAAGGEAGAPLRTNELVFYGTCDASGAVPLTDGAFAVGDDEDNVLRVYDAIRGGQPIAAVDVSDRLDLGKAKKKKKKPSAPKKPRRAPETDIEGATRVGDLAFWITSHGRNSSGKLKPERLRFFATTAPREGALLQVVGAPYEGLLADLLADPRYARFDLKAASELAPKDPGGLAIEGLTQRVEGGVFIGFRNPIPENRALLVPLLNPTEVVHGEAPRFADPVLIDLRGLGVRSMSWWRGRYLIAAGHYASGGAAKLFAWDGRGAPQVVAAADFSGFNPEGFFTPEERDRIMVLSDDGSEIIDGTECKRLEDASRKRFRGMWLALPSASDAAEGSGPQQ